MAYDSLYAKSHLNDSKNTEFKIIEYSFQLLNI